MDSDQCISTWGPDSQEAAASSQDRIWRHRGSHSLHKSGRVRKQKANKQTNRSRTQANYNESMWIFIFFIIHFSFLMVFFLKEAVHQRAFCSYIVFFLFFFTEENTVQPFFFFLLKTVSGGTSSEHMIPSGPISLSSQGRARERSRDQHVVLLVVHVCSRSTRGWLWQLFHF